MSSTTDFELFDETKEELECYNSTGVFNMYVDKNIAETEELLESIK